MVNPNVMLFAEIELISGIERTFYLQNSDGWTEIQVYRPLYLYASQRRSFFTAIKISENYQINSQFH